VEEPGDDDVMLILWRELPFMEKDEGISNESGVEQSVISSFSFSILSFFKIKIKIYSLQLLLVVLKKETLLDEIKLAQ
jgi:hypothetical protein